MIGDCKRMFEADGFVRDGLQRRSGSVKKTRVHLSVRQREGFEMDVFVIRTTSRVGDLLAQGLASKNIDDGATKVIEATRLAGSRS